MREAFALEIPLRRLFEMPTVAGLVESIEVARSTGQNLQARPILRVPRDGDLPSPSPSSDYGSSISWSRAIQRIIDRPLSD
jgi:hypothetical protein